VIAAGGTPTVLDRRLGNRAQSRSHTLPISADLTSYSMGGVDLWRRAASYVDRILLARSCRFRTRRPSRIREMPRCRAVLGRL